MLYILQFSQYFDPFSEKGKGEKEETVAAK